MEATVGRSDTEVRQIQRRANPESAARAQGSSQRYQPSETAAGESKKKERARDRTPATA